MWLDPGAVSPPPPPHTSASLCNGFILWEVLLVVISGPELLFLQAKNDWKKKNLSALAQSYKLQIGLAWARCLFCGAGRALTGQALISCLPVGSAGVGFLGSRD